VAFTKAGISVQPEIDVIWTISKAFTLPTNICIMVLFAAGGRETQAILNHQAGMTFAWSENPTQTGHYAHVSNQVVSGASYYQPQMSINHTGGVVNRKSDDVGAHTDGREFVANNWAGLVIQKESANYHGYGIHHSGQWLNMGEVAYSGNTLDNFIIPFYSFDDTTAFRRGNPIHTIRAIYAAEEILIPGPQR
jgi:hypothetical protein